MSVENTRSLSEPSCIERVAPPINFALGVASVVAGIFLTLAVFRVLPSGVNAISSLGIYGKVIGFGALGLGVLILLVVATLHCLKRSPPAEVVEPASKKNPKNNHERRIQSTVISNPRVAPPEPPPPSTVEVIKEKRPGIPRDWLAGSLKRRVYLTRGTRVFRLSQGGMSALDKDELWKISKQRMAKKDGDLVSPILGLDLHLPRVSKRAPQVEITSSPLASIEEESDDEPIVLNISEDPADDDFMSFFDNND